MKLFRKTTICLLAALIGCAAVSMTGCGRNTNSQDGQNSSADYANGEDEFVKAYSPTVPENPISEDEPGEEQNAEIGVQVLYNDKLEITLDKVVEIDSINTTDYRVLTAELTIVNKTDEGIDCSSLTHFGAVVDGNDTMAPIRDVQAAIACRKYYTATSSDLQPLNQVIEAGETHKGYIYLGMPTTWNDLQLVYTPYKYYSNDCMIFDIPTDKIEHYTDALS